MAKLAILAAVLAMFIFVDNISAYRTTVTTVEIEDGEVVHKRESEQERCRKQLQKVELDPCVRYVVRRLQPGGVLSLRGVYNDEQQLCCAQLEKIRDQRCQCSALQEIAQNLQRKFQEQQEKQQLERELENLPQTCGMRSISQCDISGRTGLDS